MADANPVTLRLPSKYMSKNSAAAGGPSSSSSSSSSSSPPIDWLIGTWAVTHSTLSMWRSARNVRISYKPLPATRDGRPRIDDVVEYEPIRKTGVRKTVRGVDTQSADGAWDWRGSGCLFFVGSHWELLGWGEHTTGQGLRERWAVTWFAPTLFTKEGLDVYCDRREGLCDDMYNKLDQALRKMEAPEIVAMVQRDMRPVEIRLPWSEA